VTLKPFPLPGTVPQYGPDRVVDVEHIDLHLVPDLAAQRMEGVCTTTVRAIEDGVRDLTLDAVDLIVGSVRDGAGRALGFRRGSTTLTVHLAEPLGAGERASFAVAYRVERPRAGLHFIAPTHEAPDKPTQCWTQSQDQYARYWFPCFDYPQAKQTTSTTIVVPSGTFALGNGRLVERRDDPVSGYATFRYVQDVPHSTYLVSMVAGAFTEVEQAGASVPVFYYVTPGREDEGERSFAKTPKMMTFFEERTGARYPYARYSQIAVADFIFGGMENTSATTLTDRTLHDERAHLDFSSDPLVAHELAHQWFGDLLTTRDWSHAWLNEGFATFFETLFREHDEGRDEYLYARYDHVRTYLREARERYARPIVENRFRYPIEVFDRHLYEKGGAVLHMLRSELGETRFWHALRTYVRDNAERSVETIDLVRAIESSTGRNLRGFFDQWVFRAGHPEVRVSYAYDRVARNASLRVEQRQPIDAANPPYRFSLDIGLLDAAPAAVERDAGPEPVAFERRHRLTIEGADQTFTFECERPPGLVRIDPDGALVGTIEVVADAEALAAILSADPSPIGRIRAAVALAKDASPPALGALATALAEDPFWAVRSEVARALGDTRSARAKVILIAAAGDPHPKVRRAVAEALGTVRGQDVAHALLALQRDDASYFVAGAALHALGKLRDPRTLDVLIASAARASWNDEIASGAVRGLAESDDPRAIAVIIDATKRDRSDPLRAEATRALGHAAERGPATRAAALQRLGELLDDDAFMVRRAALETAGKTADARFVPALDRVAASPVDARLRRIAAEAVARIHAGIEGSARVSDLEAQVESLRAECRGLRERIER
jgi:aminopeptidase N